MKKEVIRKKAMAVVFLPLCLLVLTFNNCSEANLKRLASVAPEPITFGNINPALAVRAPGCITCHAQVNGDFVTDFGYEDPFFLGLDDKENRSNEGEKKLYSMFHSKYFTHFASWEDTKIFGDLIVPDVGVTDPQVLKAYNHPDTGNAKVKSVHLKDLLFVKLFGNWAVDNVMDQVRVAFNKISPSDPGYHDPNVPGLRGQVKVKRRVFIGAPTEEELRTLKDRPESVHVFTDLGIQLHKGSRLDEVEGLVSRNDGKNGQLYFTNHSVVTCKGDIIIDGALFLNNVTIDTDARGCRLYVTKSVFIQGVVKYWGGDGGDRSLQITSARAIVMGMKGLAQRLTDEGSSGFATQGIRDHYTDETEEVFNTKIFEDRDKMAGLVNDAGPLKVMWVKDDPSSRPSSDPDHPGYTIQATMDDLDSKDWKQVPGFSPPATSKCFPNWMVAQLTKVQKPCVFDWAKGYKRKTVNYRHVLLNAPKVYSRYYGRFLGAVIAEDALFAVNEFDFRFDPVFSRVQVLPLVGDRIFKITD